jgi:hypothetical protein
MWRASVPSMFRHIGKVTFPLTRHQRKSKWKLQRDLSHLFARDRCQGSDKSRHSKNQSSRGRGKQNIKSPEILMRSGPSIRRGCWPRSRATGEGSTGRFIGKSGIGISEIPGKKKLCIRESRSAISRQNLNHSLGGRVPEEGPPRSQWRTGGRSKARSQSKGAHRDSAYRESR